MSTDRFTNEEIARIFDVPVDLIESAEEFCGIDLANNADLSAINGLYETATEKMELEIRKDRGMNTIDTDRGAIPI
jgi:hypothetical protein